jgi:hypothetical protein
MNVQEELLATPLAHVPGAVVNHPTLPGIVIALAAIAAPV